MSSSDESDAESTHELDSEYQPPKIIQCQFKRDDDATISQSTLQNYFQHITNAKDDAIITLPYTSQSWKDLMDIGDGDHESDKPDKEFVWYTTKKVAYLYIFFYVAMTTHQATIMLDDIQLGLEGNPVAFKTMLNQISLSPQEVEILRNKFISHVRYELGQDLDLIHTKKAGTIDFQLILDSTTIAEKQLKSKYKIFQQKMFLATLQILVMMVVYNTNDTYSDQINSYIQPPASKLNYCEYDSKPIKGEIESIALDEKSDYFTGIENWRTILYGSVFTKLKNIDELTDNAITNLQYILHLQYRFITKWVAQWVNIESQQIEITGYGSILYPNTVDPESKQKLIEILNQIRQTDKCPIFRDTQTPDGGLKFAKDLIDDAIKKLNALS